MANGMTRLSVSNLVMKGKLQNENTEMLDILKNVKKSSSVKKTKKPKK